MALTTLGMTKDMQQYGPAGALDISDDDEGGCDYQRRQNERLQLYNHHRFYGGGNGAAGYSPAPPPSNRPKLRDSHKTVHQRLIYKHPVDRLVDYETGVETKKTKQKLDNEQRLRDYATAMRIHNESQQASTRLRRHVKYIEEDTIMDDLRKKLGLITPSARPRTIANTPFLLETAPASVRRGTMSSTSSKQHPPLLLENGGGVDGDASNPQRPNTAPNASSSLPLIPSSSSPRGGHPPPLRLSKEVQQRLMTPKYSPRDAGGGGVGRVGYAPYAEDNSSTQKRETAVAGLNGQSAAEFEDFDIYHKGGSNGVISVDTERRTNGPVHHSVRSLRELLPQDFQPQPKHASSSADVHDDVDALHFTNSAASEAVGTTSGGSRPRRLDDAALQLDWESETHRKGPSSKSPIRQHSATDDDDDDAFAGGSRPGTSGRNTASRPSTRGKVVSRQLPSVSGTHYQPRGKKEAAGTTNSPMRAGSVPAYNKAAAPQPPSIPPPMSPRDLPSPRYALCTTGGGRRGEGIGGQYNGDASPTTVSNRPHTSESGSRLSDPRLRREHEDAVKARLEHLLQQSEEKKKERAQRDQESQVRIEDAKWRRKNPLRAQAMDRLLHNAQQPKSTPAQQPSPS